MTPLLTLFFSLGLVLLYLRLWRRPSQRLPLPPGPKGLPLIGSIFDIPRSYTWLKYAELGKIYGDIIKIEALGRTTIILQSWEAALELLEKRASNYSDRPRMVMANELAGWEWDLAHMHYSDRWRRHRRKFHQYFQPRNISLYYNMQQSMAVRFLEQLSSSPDRFAAHIRQFVSSISLRAAYGYEVKEENDFLIDLVHRAIQPLLLIVPPGNQLVEYFPFLQHVPSWFPGAGFKRDAKKWAVGSNAMLNIPFDAIKESINHGIAQQSFAHDSLRKLEVEGAAMSDEEEIIKNCAAMIYMAGSDTTASLLHSWFLAMACYPDVQRKAQAEIDKVIGSSRLPTFEDRPSTPYIEAMLLETMRWAPVTPLALPHRAVREDEYNGYCIPAGATITVNVWKILHDEELYPEPFSFKPERFISVEGKEEIEKDPILVGAFGFGRRICPGRHLATTSSWLAMASILSTYNITKCVDDFGNIIEPSTEYTDGLVSHPKSFKVQITPRQGNVEDRIKAARLGL